MSNKGSLKQFFTHNYEVIQPFLDAYPIESQIVVDPFAGAGHLLRLFNRATCAVDIDPDVKPDLVRDSFKDIPRFENALVITNPPYCYRHILQKQNRPLYERVVAAGYTDLYEYAIRRVLDQMGPVPIFTLLPENFIASRTTRLRGELCKHIKAVQIHTTTTCNHTAQPTIMVHITPETVSSTDLWLDVEFKKQIVIGAKGFRPDFAPNGNHVDFGRKPGQSKECLDTSILLQATDGGVNNRIKLLRVYERLPTKRYPSKSTDRSYVQVVPHSPMTEGQVSLLITGFNMWVEKWRESTHGLGMTSFHNNTSCGFRRKRLDFKLARQVINGIIERITSLRR